MRPPLSVRPSVLPARIRSANIGCSLMVALGRACQGHRPDVSGSLRAGCLSAARAPTAPAVVIHIPNRQEGQFWKKKKKENEKHHHSARSYFYAHVHLFFAKLELNFLCSSYSVDFSTQQPIVWFIPDARCPQRRAFLQPLASKEETWPPFPPVGVQLAPRSRWGHRCEQRSRR